jgi:two-component system NtrC family sensor kinase
MTLYSIPPILSLLCFLGLAVLSLMRKLKTTVNTLFLMLCCCGIFLYVDILIIFNITSERGALFVSRLDHVFILYSIPVFIHFLHAYLGVANRKWVICLSYGYAFCLMWFAFTPLCIEKMNRHPFGFYGDGGRLYPLIVLGAAGAMVYSIGLLLHSIRLEKRSIQKNKLKYMLAGFGMLGVLNGLNVLPLLNYAVYPPGAFSFIPLSIFAVGLFKYDLLDMGIIIKKSLLYSIITAVLTCLYAIIVTFADDVLRETRFSESILFPLLFFFFVAIVFGPIQSKIQKGMDRVFKRRNEAFHAALNHIGRRISSSLAVDRLSGELTAGIGNEMQIERVALFLENRKNHQFVRAAASSARGCRSLPQRMCRQAPLIRFSQKKTQAVLKKHLMEKHDDSEIQKVLLDMETLAAEVVFPLTINSRLIGFITLGEKRSGCLYTREEIDSLFTLSVQASLAIENAQSYRRLDALNRNLEARVHQRTLALQKALSEKEKSQEQLIRSESLAAIGQLVSGVAHELNNPLSAAISLLQSVTEDLETQPASCREASVDNRLKGDLVFAEKELHRAKQIVASLLCLSRQTHTYTEAVDINRVVDDAVKVLQGIIRQNSITVTRALETDIPSIQGNFANLGQVAINIIKNACQAAGPFKGLLHVSTHHSKDAGQIVFSCRDNGKGVPESIRNDIFKPFFTTKPVGQGTGLGLYICHEIIRKHNGQIVQKNHQDGGAVFEIFLPTEEFKVLS